VRTLFTLRPLRLMYLCCHRRACMCVCVLRTQVGSGDSAVVLGGEGELDAVAQGITPQRCLTLITLLKGEQAAAAEPA
jgi:hypothetical protein